MDELAESLDATSLETAPQSYETEFKNLLLNIYVCHELMVGDNILLPSNNENYIRDRLLEDYINKTDIRNNQCNITGFRFDKEVDVNDGRVDIKIHTKNDFENFDAFYIIECKRLDGKNTLNKAYNNDGIARFMTAYKSDQLEFYYPSHYGVNGMIGFVVSSIDIDQNMAMIGNFFNTVQLNKLYESRHDKLKLYHLMMDFSKNIETK